MNTLEMIKDWQESGFKKKYIQTNWCSELPRIVRNNGVGCLVFESFSITAKEPVKIWGTLVISEKELNSEWKEIVQEYNVHEALEKYNNGDTMVSLKTSKIIFKYSPIEIQLTESEINGLWIEKL